MNKRLTLVALVVLIAALVFALQEDPYLGGGTNLDAGQLTIVSVSQIDIVSNADDLTKSWWGVNTRVNSGGQSIVGTLTPEQTESLCSSGTCQYQSQYPLTINVKDFKETVSYDVNNDYEPIYQYKIWPTRRGGNWFGDPPTCPDWIDDIVADIRVQTAEWQIGADTRYCVYREIIGYKGSFENPDIAFSANMKLIANGKSYEDSISSSDDNAIFRDANNDIIATAQWTGSLITGDSPPNQDNFVAAYNLVTSSPTWDPVAKHKYTSYGRESATAFTKLKALEAECKPSGGYCDLANDGISSAYIAAFYATSNSEANRVVSSKDPLYSNQIMIDSTDRDADDTTLRLSLPARIVTVPEIFFKVRADWIGVLVEVGNPRITSLESVCTNSGEPQSVNVEVKNQGESASSFTVSMDECSVFTQGTSAGSNRHTLNAGEEDTYVFSVAHGSANDDLVQSCEVCVNDYNYDNEHCAQVNLCLKKAATCEPGRYYIDGNCIKQCQDTGSLNYQIQTVTQSGSLADSNGCCAYGVKYDETTKQFACSALSTAGCGNGVCDSTETITTCPSDCGDGGQWQRV